MVSQIPSCHPLNRDQSRFEAPVRLRDGRQTALQINLPPGFPQVQPALSVTHPIRHSWVDAAGRLAFPSLVQWSPSQSSLLAVVAEAYNELTGSHPPDLQSPAHRDSGTTQSGGGAHSQMQQQPRQHERQASQLDAAVPAEFPFLRGMTTEQLHLLLVDERAYAELVQQLAAQSSGVVVQRQLRGSNADLAAANLAKEGEIAELRNQIAIIRSSEFALAKEAFDKRMERQQAVLDKLSPENLIFSLAGAAEAIDAEADDLYEKFVTGDLTVDEFRQQHLAKRTKFHQLDIKRQAAEQTLI